MSALDLDLDQAIGKIHRFWWWCTKYAEDGDLRKHNDDRLARAVGLNGGQEASRFVEAMVASCWIDREPYFRVHDWWDYFGYFLMRKYGDSPDKWKHIKSLYVTVQGTVQEPSAPSLALPTKPNLTKPDITPPPAGAFDLIWGKYPNKDGMKAAKRHFQASVKTMQDWMDIQNALTNYLKSPKVLEGFIKNGSTWFNNWRDWVNYKGVSIPKPVSVGLVLKPGQDPWATKEEVEA